MPLNTDPLSKADLLQAFAFRMIHARPYLEPWVMVDRTDDGTWLAHSTFVGLIPRTREVGEPSYSAENADPLRAVMMLLVLIRKDFPLFMLEEQYGCPLEAVPLFEERDGTLWLKPEAAPSFVADRGMLREWNFADVAPDERSICVWGCPQVVAQARVIWKGGEAFALMPKDDEPCHPSGSTEAR